MVQWCPMVVFQISKQPQSHSTSAPFSSLRILRSIAFDPSGPLDVGQPLLRRWETHGWKSLQNAGDDDKLGDSYMGWCLVLKNSPKSLAGQKKSCPFLRDLFRQPLGPSWPSGWSNTGLFAHQSCAAAAQSLPAPTSSELDAKDQNAGNQWRSQVKDDLDGTSRLFCVNNVSTSLTVSFLKNE